MAEIFRFVTLTRFRLADTPVTPGPKPDTDPKPGPGPGPRPGVDWPSGPRTAEAHEVLDELAAQPDRLRAAALDLFDRNAGALAGHDDALSRVAKWARKTPQATVGDLRGAVKKQVKDVAGFLKANAEAEDRALAAYVASVRLSPGDRKAERQALVAQLRGLALLRLVASSAADEQGGRVAPLVNAPLPLPPRPVSEDKPDKDGPAKDEPGKGEPGKGDVAAELTLAELRAARDAVQAARRQRRPPTPASEDDSAPDGKPAPTSKDDGAGLPKGALDKPTLAVIARVGGDAAGPVSAVLWRLSDAARQAGRRETAGRRGRTVVPYAGGLLRQPAPAQAVTVASAASVPTSVGSARVLGVGELMVIRESLLRYEAAEIAHVENVVASEVRGRTHTARTETTTTTSLSTYDVEAATYDLATASRFELESAASKTSTRSMSFGVGASISGGAGPVQVAVETSFDASSSTTDTESSSTTFAQEVTEQATTEIRSEVRTATTTEVRVLTEEVNEHRFDNADGDHVTGVYRWLNKVVEAQVFRYGQRLMLEFVVPEPSAYLLAALGGAPAAGDGIEEPPPFVNGAGAPLEPDDVDHATYLGLAAIWGAEGVAPPPPEFVSLAVTLSFEAANGVKAEGVPLGVQYGWGNKEMAVGVPSGYRAHEFRITSTFGSHYDVNSDDKSIETEMVRVGIGNDYRVIKNTDGRDNPIWGRVEGPLDPNTDGTGLIGDVPIVATAQQRRGLALAIEIVCEQTADGLDAWRYATYQQLRAAYDAAYASYKADLEMATFGGPPVGLNPSTLRDVEAREVKRGCLEMMTGQTFHRFGALVPGPNGLPTIDRDEAEADGEYLQFFEDAFEWHLQSYVLYPYLWAGRDKHVEVLSRTSTDPVHEAFLQAGAARVTVPVRPGYELAVSRYLADGVLWNGFGPPTADEMDEGEVPFLPVFKLLAERLGRPGKEEPVGEPWEVTVPTPLVYLQPTPGLNDLPAV